MRANRAVSPRLAAAADIFDVAFGEDAQTRAVFSLTFPHLTLEQRWFVGCAGNPPHLVKGARVLQGTPAASVGKKSFAQWNHRKDCRDESRNAGSGNQI
jgi:hypothetical protein